MAWGIPAWAIVAVTWVLAIQRQWDLLLIGLALGAVALLAALGVIWAWVAHNRALAHRRERARGGRRGAPDVPLVIEADARGREVVVDEGAAGARVLVARVVDGRKVISPEASP